MKNQSADNKLNPAMTDDYDALDIRSLVRKIPWSLHECHSIFYRTAHKRFEVRAVRHKSNGKYVYGPGLTVACFAKRGSAVRRLNLLNKLCDTARVLVGP